MKKSFVKNPFVSSYSGIFSVIFAVLFSIVIISVSGCKADENTIMNTGQNDNVSVGFYSENSAGDNTLILTEAKFLLRKMMLNRDHGEGSDVKLGPFVVALDLSQKVVLTAITKIPPGDYDEIMFQVHKPNPNENVGDPEFTESTSKRYSVIAKGFYNGVPFVYKSAVTVAKEIEFEGPPVSVTEITVVNVTVRLNPISWFVNNGVILDPTNENNFHDIDQNIKNSLRRAFRDMNKDGEPD